MKAVILAAGKGTRMKNLTDARPKPMLYVYGKPILEHILLGLKDAGIKDIFIVTGYKAEVIEDYFKDGGVLGLNIHYGRQVVQDGTGRAPLVAKEFIGNDTFLLTYGDILVRAETYKKMTQKYDPARYNGLITVTRGEDVSKGAVLCFDDEFVLKHLVEKPSSEEIARLRADGLLRDGQPCWYNAGIYIFKPVIYDYISKIEKSPRGEYELTDAIIGMVNDGHKIVGMEIPGRWVDVRDPEVLARLEAEDINKL